MRIRHQLRRVLWLWVAAGLGCGNGKRPPSTPAPERPERPSVRLVMLTDLDGYLEPCGCQSRPLGGIDRAAARLKELRGDGVPTLLLAAGDLLFAPESDDPKLEGGAAEQALQRSWQAEVLAKILGQIGLEAAVPGPADLARDREQLRGLASQAGLSLLGLPEPGAQQSLVIARAGVRVGVFGLNEAADSRDLPATAAQLTKSLRERGAAIVVGLVRADARSARRIAGVTDGPDFLLHAGNDSPEVPPPERIGATTLLRAAHRGNGLLVLDLMRSGTGTFSDVSAWTQQIQKQTLNARASELAARIADWRADPKVDRGELAQQEVRLAALHREAAAPAAAVSGNVFSARFIELDKQTPSDPATRALLDAHDKRVNEHTRTALANVLPKPLPKGEPGYVGSERCSACHESAFTWWQKHPHGTAYATLQRKNAEFNLSCVGCHVTGYNQAGGSTVVHNQGLTNVGCESCHGPGSLHAKNADVDEAKNVRREVEESVCKHCHNAEHSDHFDYAKYREKLIVKGHGLPAEHVN